MSVNHHLQRVHHDYCFTLITSERIKTRMWRWTGEWFKTLMISFRVQTQQKQQIFFLFYCLTNEHQVCPNVQSCCGNCFLWNQQWKQSRTINFDVCVCVCVWRGDLWSFYEVSEWRRTKTPIPKDKHSFGVNDPENSAVSSDWVKFSSSRTQSKQYSRRRTRGGESERFHTFKYNTRAAEPSGAPAQQCLHALLLHEFKQRNRESRARNFKGLRSQWPSAEKRVWQLRLSWEMRKTLIIHVVCKHIYKNTERLLYVI